MDFVTSSLALDFYMWMVYTGPTIPAVEFMNSKKYQMTLIEDLKDFPGTDEKYVVYRVSGIFDQTFDLKNYPFDRFSVTILLEDTEKEDFERTFVPDTAESGIDPFFQIIGWQSEPLRLQSKVHQYDTTFGEPGKKTKESYSQICVSTDIFRDHRIIFIKMVTPAILFLLISIVGILLPIEQLSQKISLCVAALFSSVAYHLSMAQGLPPISYLTFVDKMMISIYLTIFINMLLTVFIFLAQSRQRVRWERHLSLAARIVLPLMATSIVGWLILHGFYS